MPRVSVVVPIYNVEPYLEECLASIAGQTFDDLEVIVVDDGSTDGSAAIAERFAARDPRFRIITQENGGLGNARNTGADAATGEFLAFVDSDDVLPLHAYKTLVDSLDETGSDFATGNVHRLTKVGAVQSPFLAAAFARTRPKTHVTQYRPLIADRIVPNKLWRRSFWDAGGYRFPEGMLHEDIPVVVPAHFAAKSVDVISEPVYHYRIRAGEDLSITQRRLEKRALLDRMKGIERVTEHLGKHGPRGSRRWYEQSVVADDLRYYINVLDSADEEYRELFLDRLNAYLDKAHRKTFDPLPAIERLKWHLVRRRLMPELLEVLRFQKDDLAFTPPVQDGGRWYGDFPFRTDKRLAIPSSVYLVEDELVLHTQVEELRREGDKLVVEGFTYISGVGAPAPDTQQVAVSALRPGRLRRLRLITSAVKLKTEVVERPDVTAKTRQRLVDLRWAGFRTTIDPGALRGRDGSWEIFMSVRAGKLRRRRSRGFLANPIRPIRAAELPVAAGTAVKIAPALGGGVSIEKQSDWLTIRDHGFGEGDALHVSGEAHGAGAGKLEVVRRDDSLTFSYPLAVEDDTFGARVPLADLRGAKPPRKRSD
ncbi:MAG: CDP-glycerol glycerophosphotransferase, partial [Thermoleophilaceae bacterium]|nr:CDP-glycerol glycerophosphotransferase [Thermoleophilaceae bacterium]